ncbi:MAG: hypothetical protein ACYS0C_06370 [Planctomycetota bacterium]
MPGRFLHCAMLRIASVEMTRVGVVRIASVEMTRVGAVRIASVEMTRVGGQRSGQGFLFAIVGLRM